MATIKLWLIEALHLKVPRAGDYTRYKIAWPKASWKERIAAAKKRGGFTQKDRSDSRRQRVLFARRDARNAAQMQQYGFSHFDFSDEAWWAGDNFSRLVFRDDLDGAEECFKEMLKLRNIIIPMNQLSVVHF